MNLGSPEALPYLRWDAETVSLVFRDSAGPLARFGIDVDLVGRIFRPAAWNALPDGGAWAADDGLEVRITIRRLDERRMAAVATLVNHGAAGIGVAAIRFVARDWRLAGAGASLRLYAEGWTMTTPAMSVRSGEPAPALNPDYLPFAIPDPSDPDIRHQADGVVVCQDAATGRCLLVGFATSAVHTARVLIRSTGSMMAGLEAVCIADGAILPPGGRMDSEELVVSGGDDGSDLLAGFADLWAARMHARPCGQVPTGWCSWYRYFEHVTAADVEENVAWLAANRDACPVSVVQVDDGHQSALGDWLASDPVRFPAGLAALADGIRQRGFTPGLWLAPFLVEERSRLYAEHPDWMVRDRDGRTVWAMDWRGGSRTAILDGTHPGALAWLTAVFAELARLGFGYVKLDFLVHACAVTAKGGVYADRSATRLQALRRGLEAIRRGFGENRFILACTNVLGAGVGIVDACRIATDLLPDWNRGNEPFREAPTVPNVCRNVINRRYLHRRLWLNDPDTLIVRREDNRLSEDEVLLWASALAIAGGLLFSGDRLSGLAPERLRILRRLLADRDAFADARPLDRFAEEFPSVWVGRDPACPDSATVALMNFTDQPRSLRLDPGRLWQATGPVRANDFWTGEALEVPAEGLDIALRTHASRLLVLTRD